MTNEQITDEQIMHALHAILDLYAGTPESAATVRRLTILLAENPGNFWGEYLEVLSARHQQDSIREFAEFAVREGLVTSDTNIAQGIELAKAHGVI